MASRGFLIRFIDIGLIVLFGFLMISEIETGTRVELASPVAEQEEEEETPEEKRAFTTVEIAPDGSFTVRDPGSGEIVADALLGTDALAGTLARIAEGHVSAGLETVVLVRPHEASAVQHTVDVLDVCDRLALRKSLQMETASSRAGEDGP